MKRCDALFIFRKYTLVVDSMSLFKLGGKQESHLRRLDGFRYASLHNIAYEWTKLFTI